MACAIFFKKMLFKDLAHFISAGTLEYTMTSFSHTVEVGCHRRFSVVVIVFQPVFYKNKWDVFALHIFPTI